MRHIAWAVVMIAFGFILSLPASAAGVRVNAFEKVFAQIHCSTGGVCKIKPNYGGIVEEFMAAANLINHSNLTVAINVPCYSSCSDFADKARNHVCIGPHAEFGFHLQSLIIDESTGKGIPGTGNPPPPNSAEIKRWVKLHGGYPPPEQLLRMEYKDALQFWRPCSQAELA